MRYLLLCLFAFGVLTVSSQAGTPKKGKDRKTADHIKSTYESKLYRLSPKAQRHFGVRMYRITGDTTYLNPIVYDLLLTLNELQQDVAGFHDSMYIANRDSDLLDGFNTRTRKGRLRKEVLSEWPGLMLYLRMTYNLGKVEEYRLSDTGTQDLLQQVKANVQSEDFKAALLDDDVVRAYSPQVVNQIYYMSALSLGDLRQQFKSVFQRVFADSLDDGLGPAEFRDKMYGLTHFVFAASGYYQHTVDSTEFGWILSYFDRKSDRILDECTADIVAEVGICFLLADKANHKMVARCKQRVLSKYSSKHRMVLSPSGKRNLEKGEHRNILAYMLLAWPWQLHPGPYLEQLQYYRRLMIR